MRRPVQRHAHRVPPKRWDQAVFVVCLIMTILFVVTFIDPSFHL